MTKGVTGDELSKITKKCCRLRGFPAPATLLDKRFAQRFPTPSFFALYPDDGGNVHSISLVFYLLTFLKAPTPHTTARLPLHCEKDEDCGSWANEGPGWPQFNDLHSLHLWKFIETGVFPNVQEKYNEIARYFEHEGKIGRTMSASTRTRGSSPSNERENTGLSDAQIWRIYCVVSVSPKSSLTCHTSSPTSALVPAGSSEQHCRQ